MTTPASPRRPREGTFTTPILVVDHDPIEAHCLAAPLDFAGFTVERAHDADEALARARATPPALVIAGACPGGTDALLSRWRADPQLRRIPFVACEDLPADPPDAVLSRPASPSIVLETVEDMLRMGATGERSTDVAERRRRRESAEARSRRLRELSDQLADGVFVLTHDFRIVEVNTAAAAMLGYRDDELVGLHVGRLMPSFENARLPRKIVDIGPDSPPIEEWQVVRKDGARILVETSRRQVDGERLLIVARDVTESRRQADLLRKLSLAVEQSSQSVVITDTDGNIEYANQAAQVSSGYALDELVGRNPRVLKSGRTPPLTYVTMWRHLTAGRPWQGMLHNRRKDGTEYIEFALIQPIRNGAGAVTNHLALKEDVTERLAMGEELARFRHHLDDLVDLRTGELARAKQAAEEASQAKSAFLATMSHEIRTPMNGVIGLVEVLRQSCQTPYLADLADTIRDSAHALLGVIDDILDFSKIEAGRMELAREPVSLANVVEGVCDGQRAVAAQRAVRLHVFVDPALPARIVSDSARLRQILNNLVSNALKFSAGRDRAGSVAVRAESLDTGRVRLVVADNGIGMTEEVRAGIFDAFKQAENSTTRRFGGTGLGLSICRRLVDLLGGAIEVHSIPDEGSTFVITLPVEIDSRAVDAGTASDLAGLECLVSARDPTHARDWSAYLRAAGASASCAAPGTEAAWLGERSRASGAVVIVETCSESDPICATAAGEGCGVVALTVGGGHAPRTVRAGLVKLDPDTMHRTDLLRAVAIAAGRAREDAGDAEGTRAGRPSLPTIDGRGRRILVAEDNDINQKVIRHQLALLGLSAEVAGDGAEALERWRSGRYDLLLTDLHMPRMDGYGLTAAVRREEKPGERRFPVIALTANAVKGEAARCLAAGMDECLTKPVQLERLGQMLARWLGEAPARTAGTTHEGGRTPIAGAGPQPDAPRESSSDSPASASSPPAAGAATGSTAEAGVARTAAPPAEVVLDATVLAGIVGDDPALQAEFQRDFLASARKGAGELRAAISSGTWAKAGSVAHWLKSSARTVGAMALGEVCAELEQAGKAGDGATVARLQGAFDHALEQVRAALSGTVAPVVREAMEGVLLVDDDPVQLRALERQLGTLGFAQTHGCTSGPQALAALDGRDTSGLLVLLDLNMPGMDGVEFMRHLAAVKFEGTLALLSGVDERVLETASNLAHSYGLNTIGHLAKPVSTGQLQEALRQWREFVPGTAQDGGKPYAPDTIRRAIRAGEMLMRYQPRIEIATGRMSGVEALVRWRHPTDGIVYPDRFVAVAEEHGMIEELSQVVLTQTLAQVRRWRDDGLVLRVAVKITMQDLARLDFPEFVLDEAARAGTPPSDLVLQVPESRLMRDARVPREVLTRLRLKGVGLAVEGFGAGQASLAQIQDIPFQELKIDRSVVRGARARTTQRAMFSAALGMAHQLGMRAVAEGIESRADWDLVRDAGFDLAQGHFVAMPMPAHDLVPWEQRWRDRVEGVLS